MSEVNFTIQMTYLALVDLFTANIPTSAMLLFSSPIEITSYLAHVGRKFFHPIDRPGTGLFTAKIPTCAMSENEFVMIDLSLITIK